MYKKLGLLSFILCFSLPTFAGIEGSISGLVEDSQGVAIPNASVELHPLESKQSNPEDQSQVHTKNKLKNLTQTSSTGEFQFFPVIFGDYEIVIEREGFQSATSIVHVASSGDSQVKIALNSLSSDKEMVVEVKAKRNLIQNSSSVSSVQINQDMIRQLPQGEQVSLPQLLSSTTPGIVQGAFGQTFIRGNHASIQYQIDGVQLPDSPSSTFGEAFSPRNIDHMEVITGGIPAEYGERLAAVVNIVTKSGTETPGGEIELNYGSYNRTSPQVTYGGSNEAGDLHYYFSVNYNRTDRGLDTPQPQSESNQSQGGTDAIHDSANGNNQFLKLDWQANNSNKVTMTAFSSYSFYQIPNFPSSFLPTDPFFGEYYTDQFGNTGAAVYRPSNTNDTQAEWNQYFQVVWKHTFSPQSFLQVAPYWKYSNIKVTNDFANDLADPKGEGTSFTLNRHTNNAGLKVDYSIRPDDRNSIKAGIQLQASQADGVVTVFHDNVLSVNSDPNLGFYENAYLQDDFIIFKPLILKAGVRFSATQFNFSGNNPTDYQFQPRIGLQYLLTETTKFHVFYGKLFQPASLENLRVTYNNLGFNPGLLPYDIKAEKDDYYEFGVEQQFAETQIASFNLYYKKGTNVIDEEQIVNTSIAQPFNFAQGYAYGAEVSVRGQISPEWSEYVNYSYGVGKGRGLSGGVFVFASDPEDAPGANYQMLDHIQLHTVSSGLTFSKNYFWATGQGLYGSGLRTGPNNSISLPGHFVMNTTFGYEFHGSSWLSQWKASLDLLNIFDNAYPITIANGYNGSHYAAGRQFFLHLTKAF